MQLFFCPTYNSSRLGNRLIEGKPIDYKKMNHLEKKICSIVIIHHDVFNAIKRRLYLLIVLYFLTTSVKCQSIDECKYLAVLTYLRTNRTVNNEIKKNPKLSNKKR